MIERRERIKHGGVEVIAGPMFCGKTEELIRRLTRETIAHKNIQVFKPSNDTRYNALDEIKSHSGSSLPATRIDKENPKEILNLVKPITQVVGIDESQFFGKDLVNVCEELASKGIRVVVAGLDADFRGEPFGSMPSLMAKAELVDKLTAVCNTCGEPASFTQRVVNGKPANYHDPVEQIGGMEAYEARCRQHHQVPGKHSSIIDTRSHLNHTHD